MPAEGTASYKENADQKATFVAERTGRLTLGDDSGIEVFALDGRPGIISARFAGEPVSDQRNIERLLSELDGDGSGDRSARFVCWLALAGSNGLIASVEGTCAGTIGFEPAGTNGFGYDPIFVFPDGRTMAELTDEEKDARSHRGNAIRSMLPALRRAVVDGDAMLESASTHVSTFSEWRSWVTGSWIATNRRHRRFARQDNCRLNPGIHICGKPGYRLRSGRATASTSMESGNVESSGPGRMSSSGLDEGTLDIAIREVDWATAATLATGPRLPMLAVTNVCAEP